MRMTCYKNSTGEYGLIRRSPGWFCNPSGRRFADGWYGLHANFDSLGTTQVATLPTNWKADKNNTVRLVARMAPR